MSPALSYSVEGRTHILTLRAEEVPAVRQALARYGRAQEALERQVRESLRRWRQRRQRRAGKGARA